VLTRSPMLAVRDGRLFLAAQALDALAIGVALVALPWLVLRAGGSAARAGLVYPVTIAPYFLFGLVAGVAGDRFPRRALMLCSHAGQAAFAAIIPVWSVVGTPPFGVVLAVGFAVGSGRVFVDAAAFGAVAAIVGTERFVDGQAALSAAWSLGLFAGPALGGALVGAVGPGFALASEAAALALAALVIACVRAPLGRGLEHTGEPPVREGLRFMARDRAIATLTAVSVAWSLLGAGAFALVVPLLRDEVGLGSAAVGTILAVGALAGLSASLVVGRLSRRFGAASLLCACYLVAPITIAALGAAGSFAVALVAEAASVLIAGVVSVVVISERQRRAPQRLQGRVGIAGRMVLLAAMAAGSALASTLTGPLGTRTVYLAMAAGTFAVAAATAPLLLRLSD
jgi:MFS family permease